jgi:hypothetical protein
MFGLPGDRSIRERRANHVVWRLVRLDTERGSYVREDADQLVVDLDQSEVRDPLVSGLAHANGPDGREGSSASQSPRKDLGELAAGVQLRPRLRLVVANFASPAALRAGPRDAFALAGADKSVIVFGAARHGRSQNLLEVTLSCRDEHLDRFPRVKVRQSDPMSTLLACLDHERFRVSILRPTTDEHRTAHGQVAEHQSTSRNTGSRSGSFMTEILARKQETSSSYAPLSQAAWRKHAADRVRPRRRRG